MGKRNVHFYLKVKRFFDFTISLLGLIVLIPLFVIISIAIKLDSEGPVIFKQSRLGKDGKPFTMYKFRSMVVGASNIGTCNITVKNDNRVTRVGKFIRITSIDELPQLFNVLKGEMSLIGPRPISHFKYEDFSKEQQRRFELRPGLTGLSQITDRKTLNLNTKCKYDIQYVDSVNFLLDLKIFFITFLVLTKNNF